MTRTPILAGLLLLAGSGLADDLGQLSVNRFAPNSTSNPFSPAGSPFSPTSINNSFGAYGSRFSSQSATNPAATDPPKLYDEAGHYRGTLSANPYAPDSIANPFGRYGSRFSPESINNPFGAGSPYKPDSPVNPFGTGWRIVAGDED